MSMITAKAAYYPALDGRTGGESIPMEAYHTARLKCIDSAHVLSTHVPI